MATSCPTPMKVEFSTRKRALESANRGKSRARLYAYKCVCKAWHITSSPPRNQ